MTFSVHNTQLSSDQIIGDNIKIMKGIRKNKILAASKIKTNSTISGHMYMKLISPRINLPQENTLRDATSNWRRVIDALLFVLYLNWASLTRWDNKKQKESSFDRSLFDGKMRNFLVQWIYASKRIIAVNMTDENIKNLKDNKASVQEVVI